MVQLDVAEQGQLLDEISDGADSLLRALPEEVASAEKILPQHLAALARTGDEEARRRLRQLQLRQDELAAELGKAAEALLAVGVPFVLLRGFALQRLYPSGQLRQFNDLDLVIPEPSSVPATIAALGSIGHHVVRPVTAWVTPRGLWAGLALNKASGRELPFYVDVAVGGPALGWGAHHTIAERAWALSEELPPVPAARTLAITDLAVAFLVEMVERERCVVRDGVDFLALIHTDGFDAGAVAERVSGVPLRHGLLRLLRLLRACGRSEAKRLAALFAAAAAPPTVPQEMRRAAAKTLATTGRFVGARWFDMARRLASDRSAALAALRSGLPVFLFPDPDGRLAGLPGGHIDPALGRFTARLRPIASEAESAYCFSGKEWWL